MIPSVPEGSIHLSVSFYSTQMIHRIILTDCINLASLDALESRSVVIFIIRETRKRRPDCAMLDEKDKLGS